jgi:Flp pilus assembly protein TadD
VHGLRLLPLLSCCSLLACGSLTDQSARSRSAILTDDAKLRVAEAADVGGDGDLALSMYVAAAQNAPTDVPLQLRCADALARRGHYGEAKQLLTDRLKTNPRQPELTRGLALVYLISGDPRHAIEMLDQILAARPDDAAALTDKGIAMDLLQRHAEAQALYRQALASSPNDPAINNDLALSMMLEGRTREAQQILEPFKGAEAPRRLTTNLGILLAANGRMEQARPLVEGQVSNDELQTIAKALSRGTAPAAAP